MALAVSLSGALARARGEIGANAEAAYVRTDRRDCSGSDHQPAGSNRRPPKLGLSIYVAAGCGLYGLCVCAHRLYGGSSGVRALDTELCRETRASGGEDSRDVLHLRQSRIAGAGTEALGRLHEVEAGAHRQ